MKLNTTQAEVLNINLEKAFTLAKLILSQSEEDFEPFLTLKSWEAEIEFIYIMLDDIRGVLATIE